jgi:hypothetical protein
MNNIICPCCKEDTRIYFKLNWNKKFYDFACGKCRLELEIPKNFVGKLNDVIGNIFAFDILNEIKEKVDKMTYEEKIVRLKELESKKK